MNPDEILKGNPLRTAEFASPENIWPGILQCRAASVLKRLVKDGRPDRAYASVLDTAAEISKAGAEGTFHDWLGGMRTLRAADIEAYLLKIAPLAIQARIAYDEMKAAEKAKKRAQLAALRADRAVVRKQQDDKDKALRAEGKVPPKHNRLARLRPEPSDVPILNGEIVKVIGTNRKIDPNQYRIVGRSHDGGLLKLECIQTGRIVSMHKSRIVLAAESACVPLVRYVSKKETTRRRHSSKSTAEAEMEQFQVLGQRANSNKSRHGDVQRVLIDHLQAHFPKLVYRGESDGPHVGLVESYVASLAGLGEVRYELGEDEVAIRWLMEPWKVVPYADPKLLKKMGLDESNGN